MAAVEIERTALVVENDEALVEEICGHLARTGYHITQASSGWEALTRVKDNMVDVVILDHTMATAEGCSLRERFLLDPDLRSIPFVLLIPEGGSVKDVTVLLNGVDDFIVKPFDLHLLISRVETVLQRRKAYEEMVRVDPLTRLLNRPALENQVADELARIVRYERFASIALLDVDDLDNLNQEYGQAMGDLIMTCLGGIILASTRTVDIAGRWRGKRFVLYLPETEPSGASVLLSRTVERFQDATDAIVGVKATFTAGIVQAPEHGTVFRELLGHAQQAVARAKDEGGGRVLIWSEEQ